MTLVPVPAKAGANTLEGPPRLTGNPAGDAQMQMRWQQAFFDRWAQSIQVEGTLKNFEARIVNLESGGGGGGGGVSTFNGRDGAVLLLSADISSALGFVPAPAYNLPVATTTILGGVKVDGTTITIDGSSVIHGTPALLVATNTVLGGIKPDQLTLTVDPSTGAAAATTDVYDWRVRVPALGGFTQVGISGGTTVAQSSTSKAITISDTGTNVAELRGLSIAVPTPPYRVAILAQWTAPDAQWTSLISGFTDGTKFDIQRFAVARQNFHENWSTRTSRAGSASVNPPMGGYNVIWIGLSDDGTNIALEFSTDGVNFTPSYKAAKSGAYLGSSGYTNIFIGIDTETTTVPNFLTIRVYDPNGLSRTL